MLAEYGQGHRVRELNLAAATIARDAASDFSTPDRPRWVAGSIGPGTKFPTLGQIRYADLRDFYQEQAAALIEGEAMKTPKAIVDQRVQEAAKKLHIEKLLGRKPAASLSAVKCSAWRSAGRSCAGRKMFSNG